MFRPLFIRNKFFVHLIVLPLLLSVIGLFFIFEASSIRGFNESGDSLYYLKLQAVWFFIGLGVFIFFSLFDYHKLYYFSFLAMLLTIFFLVIVLLPGVGYKAGGARRWIDFGFFNFQPTELAKFSVIIYLASWFIYKERKRFFSFLILVGILMGLIIMQPDMGTATIVFGISIIIYYLAGMNIFHLIGLIPVVIGAGFILIKLSPYRLNRLLAFFDPKRDPLGITYHINQILISLSNGGFFGQGFGSSRQKYLFLPEAHTDSIFAIIGEEFGFMGGIIIIFLYFIFIYKIFKIIINASDRFGKLLAGGIFAFFNLQVLINLAGVVNLLPLTGVPLPFISYGGSNLIISFAFIGILVNIEKKIKKIVY